MELDIARATTYFLAMLISLTVHEAAHAWVAKLCGDDTAEKQGRLTLNPAPHIDPVGTIMLPLMGALFNFGILGWAKPVPVDLRNLENERWDHFKIAAAGPVSNLIFCFLCVLGYVGYHVFIQNEGDKESFFYPLVDLLRAMGFINAILAIFNLLPLPPLDGGTVFSTFLPKEWADKYEAVIAPNGFIILLILLLVGGLHWIGPVAATYVGLMETLSIAIISII